MTGNSCVPDTQRTGKRGKEAEINTARSGGDQDRNKSSGVVEQGQHG